MEVLSLRRCLSDSPKYGYNVASGNYEDLMAAGVIDPTRFSDSFGVVALPGGRYTNKFTIQGQEGTLWWHAHSSYLRATFYGALIIPPKDSTSYPFTKPKREAPVILGEWWNANPIDVVRQATKTGAAPNTSDAFTINGSPGTSTTAPVKEEAKAVAGKERKK